VRIATDNGSRTSLDDFVEELGLADEVAALGDCEDGEVESD
jgi:hypothetical protein